MRVKSLAGAVKSSMRGKSCNTGPTLKMALDVSGTQAVCCLGSEDGPVESPSSALEEVAVGDESAGGVEPLHPRASPGSVEVPGGAPGKTLSAVKKQRKVSSKLGPSIRQQERGIRPEQEPSGQRTGLTGQGIPRPLSTPRPHTTTEGALNQPPGSVGKHRAASKLPVKGSANFSPLENNDNTAMTAASSTTGTSPTERPSRSLAKPVPPASPSAPSVTAVHASFGVPKLRATRGRASTVQARTSVPNLKSTAVIKDSTAKTPHHPTAKNTPAASRPVSQHSLLRSSSVRPCRGHTSVDKNKQAASRQTYCNGVPQGPASDGQKQKHQQISSDLMPDAANGNAPVATVAPVADFKSANAVSSTAAARPGSRSALKAASHPQSASKASGADATVPTKHNQSREHAEKKKQAIAQLRRMLIQGNKRVEALATVIQHVFSEREEALKQKGEISSELANTRDELAMSTQCCKRLQKEKEEMRTSFEGAVKSLEWQHKEELVLLENRLKTFYQREWDKVHQIYQEEADKCCMLMEEQVERLRKQQQAERDNQEVIQTQRMDSLKSHYESSIQELKRTHEKDLDNLEKSLKRTETSLSDKIFPLSTEKEALYKKLKEEEDGKHLPTEKNSDSHVLYLEQELESLKAVLEIRNNQLHQKEKKLMEMDKLMEANIKLEECLKRVQQENEDYKARMDKYAALSKQLSSEQVVLQQSLQKESKVNKRLSMENEELLWKLQNCDLLPSPCRLSPTSPFNSPGSSAAFPTAAPLSPR